MAPEIDPEHRFLGMMRSELARIYHDISNPLAIVSGNLELIVELEEAGASRDEIVASLKDANSAVGGFAAPLKSLMAIREEIDGRLRDMGGDSVS